MKTYTKDEVDKKLAFVRAQLKASELEWFRRGAELEKLNSISSAWKDLIPDAYYAEVRAVLDPYIARCTVTKGNENKKYKKRK